MEPTLVRILSRNVYVRVLLVAGLFALLLVPNAGTSARSTAQSVPIAITVYGQADSFTTKDINHGGLSAASLYWPRDAAVDGRGGLYVADTFNNRVLHYPARSITPDRVYGQGGLFTRNDLNHGGLSAASLRLPCGVAVDGSGGLYVADTTNERVLYYRAGSTIPDRVYGQGGLFTTRDRNHGGVSAASLYEPTAVAVDGRGGLYVVDGINARVLHYPAGSTTADRVYGQGGLFTTGPGDFNHGGLSAASLHVAFGVAVDGSGGLYLADSANNRVLHYPAGSTTADRVYGQGGLFTTGGYNHGGVSATSLAAPQGVAVDGSGGLYVVDTNNNRVLYYPGKAQTHRASRN